MLGRWDRVGPVVRERRLVLALSFSALLVTINWFVYIWAVQQARLVEASLGYYINPLLVVFLGMLFLGERLRPLQWMALALAAAGVVNELIAFGKVPWIAFGEPFRDSQWLTFAAIWSALLIFALDGLYHHRRKLEFTRGRGS